MTAERVWDVVVVGAGPAGAVAARGAARRGKSVLLVDKAMFPRAKVCGCCLNGSALGTLRAIGLGDLVRREGAVPLSAVTLVAGGRRATVRMTGGVTLSRERFDVALIRAAVEAGVEFRPGTTAKLLPAGAGDPVRRLRLERGPVADAVEARVVVAADGLNGQLTAADGNRPAVRAGSRIGAGAQLDSAPSWCPPGRLIMAVGKGGYVGLVRLEDGRLDLAAALDPAAVRAAGGLGLVSNAVLVQNGLILPDVTAAAWRGTPALTRTPRAVAGYRWFAAGDAAGYVEPFTGEGMAWAVGSAARLGEVLAADWAPGLAADWAERHAAGVQVRQRLCRALAWGLRSPTICRAAVRVLGVVPAAARPVVAHLNRVVRRG